MMKRLYALFLGVVLVFAMATMASALDFSVSGVFNFHGDHFPGDSFFESWEWTWDDCCTPMYLHVFLTLSEELGNAKFEATWTNYEDYAQYSHGSLMYQFSDLLKAGVTLTGEYSDIDEADHSDLAVFEPVLASIYYHHLDYEEVYATLGFDFGDGGLTVFKQLSDSSSSDFGFAGSYAWDRVSIGGGFYDNYDVSDPNYEFYVKYAINEEFSLLGDLAADEYNDYRFAGLQAAYDNGAFAAKVSLLYELDYKEIADWSLEFSYQITDLVMVEAKWLENDGYGLVLRDSLCTYNDYDVDGIMVGVFLTFDERLNAGFRYWFNDDQRLEMIFNYSFAL